MILIIKYLILLFGAIVFHEIGHYILYRLYGYTPSINFKWYGIVIGENVYQKIRLDRYFFILIAGPILGLFIAIWNPIVLLGYILGCGIDFIAIFAILWYDANGQRMELYTLKSLQQKISQIEFWRSLTKKEIKWYEKLYNRIIKLK